ncbi:MAG: helix-turn-helix domain-containing protein [Candidatus Woesearchaeota archaeon]
MPKKLDKSQIESIDRLRRNGYTSREIARIEGISRTTVFVYANRDKTGYNSTYDYSKEAIHKRGYESYGSYLKKRFMIRRERFKNRVLSSFINNRLRDIGHDKTWLAEQTGLPRQTLSSYVDGTKLPKRVCVVENIFRVLGSDYKSIEDLVEDCKIEGFT